MNCSAENLQQRWNDISVELALRSLEEVSTATLYALGMKDISDRVQKARYELRKYKPSPNHPGLAYCPERKTIMKKPEYTQLEGLGELIIAEVIKQGMVSVRHPDPDEAHLFIWSGNANEQLECVVAEFLTPDAESMGRGRPDPT